MVGKLGAGVLGMIGIAALAGCTSTPSLGDRIAAEGGELSVVGDQWSRGEALVEEGQEQQAEGRKMIKRGRKLIADGENLVDEGEDNVEAGTALVEKAEQSYRVLTGKELPADKP